ncbi:MAG: corrinoid protein [Burkholderiales bacterium]
MSVLTEISTFLQQGKAAVVKELVAKALQEGLTAQEILSDGLLAGMGVIGAKFKNNEVYVPEVLIAARAMNAGMEVLKPVLVSSDTASKGKVILGTVKGDLHDIGKNLVKIMLEGKGLQVIDLGTDVAPQAFVDAAIKENANIIACSALLTTTMIVMKDVVKEAEVRGIKGKVKIMVGGAPVTQNYCDTIGADYYTSDAASAADVAYNICQG